MGREERIIVLPFLLAFGGVERLVVGLSRFLRERDQPHRILCFESTIDLGKLAGWPIEVEVLPSPRNPLAEAWALHRRLRPVTSRPLFFDLKGAFYAALANARDYHVHLTDPPSLLPRDLSKLAPSARRAHAPLRTSAPAPLVRMLRAEAVHQVNRRGVRRAAGVVAMTHAIAAELSDLYDVRPQIVRPGVRPPAVAPAAALTARPPRFLSLSRLEPNKRIDWILRALVSLADRDWQLDVVGDGSERAQLEALTVELGLAGNVRFHGRVSDAEVEALWAASTLFLMPAVQGYGLPALEALARGVPVVLHRDSGVAEILGGTLWVEILADGGEALTFAIARMVQRQRSGELERASRPPVPTEHDWAAQLCAACGWTDQALVE